ncbi:hypothetical protein VNI00_014191 [Paramarasmius palmivorus]|uniref:Uncharacterized protein n=1 Tax=Paramarasmius palmivorus TaxID=297713 RepID=A0AAW0BWK9_9AGAR
MIVSWSMTLPRAKAFKLINVDPTLVQLNGPVILNITWQKSGTMDPELSYRFWVKDEKGTTLAYPSGFLQSPHTITVSFSTTGTYRLYAEETQWTLAPASPVPSVQLPGNTSSIGPYQTLITVQSSSVTPGPTNTLAPTAEITSAETEDNSAATRNIAGAAAATVGAVMIIVAVIILRLRRGKRWRSGEVKDVSPYSLSLPESNAIGQKQREMIGRRQNGDALETETSGDDDHLREVVWDSVISLESPRRIRRVVYLHDSGWRPTPLHSDSYAGDSSQGVVVMPPRYDEAM